jgi:putative SOS response-associated peptidase YedK
MCGRFVRFTSVERFALLFNATTTPAAKAGFNIPPSTRILVAWNSPVGHCSHHKQRHQAHRNRRTRLLPGMYRLSNGFEKFPGKIVEKFPDEWCGYGVSTAFFRCLNR